MNYSDLELAGIQAEVLYEHDSEGRLLRVNEPDPEEPTPRFFLARTLTGNMWRTRYDLPGDLRTELDRLASAEPVAHDLREPPRYIGEYTRLLAQHAPIESTHAGPAYYLPEFNTPEDTVTITPENAELVRTYFPYTLSMLAERAPVVAVVADGVAVTACYSARSTAQAAEAGVYTQEAYRGRGYAVLAVQGWAAAVRAGGRLPLYSTSWDNTASQAVAAKLGAVLYAADLSLA